jgi:hypothetical protein
MSPYGSGQAFKHNPQPLQTSKFSTTGVNPVAGLISVPIAMQPLGHDDMQRPQALQYSGNRNGFGLTLVFAFAIVPALENEQ